jgi:hypothetical protein
MPRPAAAALITALAALSACGSPGQPAAGHDSAGTPQPAAAPGGTTPAATTTPTATTTEAALDGCLPPTLGRQELVPEPGGNSLTLGVLGTGKRVVLLCDESDETLCSWLPFARRLVAAGYRVVVWDFGGIAPSTEVAIVARRLAGDGATRLVLMGASEGAKASLVAAASLGAKVQGVVSLSAEAVLYPGITVLGYVRRLHCPLLLVTAKQDPYGSADSARQFLAAAPAQAKHVVAVAGAAHGTALLTGQPAGTVLPAVLAFLHRVLT